MCEMIIYWSQSNSPSQNRVGVLFIIFKELFTFIYALESHVQLTILTNCQNLLLSNKQFGVWEGDVSLLFILTCILLLVWPT